MSVVYNILIVVVSFTAGLYVDTIRQFIAELDWFNKKKEAEIDYSDYDYR